MTGVRDASITIAHATNQSGRVPLMAEVISARVDEPLADLLRREARDRFTEAAQADEIDYNLGAVVEQGALTVSRR